MLNKYEIAICDSAFTFQNVNFYGVYFACLLDTCETSPIGLYYNLKWEDVNHS